MLIAVVAIHVLGAALWFGSSVLLVAVVSPALAAAGPEAAGAVGAQLFRRIPPVLGTTGAVTILSGLLLYWLVSGGGSGFMKSTNGMLVGLGALCGFAAMGTGIITGRLGPRGANFARASVVLLFCALTLMIVGSRA